MPDTPASDLEQNALKFHPQNLQQLCIRVASARLCHIAHVSLALALLEFQ